MYAFSPHSKAIEFSNECWEYVCVCACSVPTVYRVYVSHCVRRHTYTHSHTLHFFEDVFFRSIRKIWFQEPRLIAMHPYKCVANCNLWSMTMQCDDATNRFICIYSMVQFINRISYNYPDGVFLVHYISLRVLFLTHFCLFLTHL